MTKYTRLDRIFGNVEWMMKLGHLLVEYDLSNVSEYSPMFLSFKQVQPHIKVPFIFFNVWADHNKFYDIVKAAWKKNFTSNKLDNIWAKLKAPKLEFKHLNNEYFRNTTQNIEKARLDLARVQRQMQTRYSDQLLTQEKCILQNLEKWSLVEENIMRQKSRAIWIQLGDSNTKYFLVVLKERTQRMQILELRSNYGVQLVDQSAIKDEIIRFYKGLMGTATPLLPAVNKLVIRRGPQLQHQQRICLIAPVTDKKIFASLNVIGDDKDQV